MKQFYFMIIAIVFANATINANEYTWQKIREKGTFSAEKLGLSSTGYDREKNIIYSMSYVQDVLTVLAIDIDRDTIYEIPNTGAPDNLRTFTFDYTNDRLIAIRSGREQIYALSTSGGEWVKLGEEGYDSESYCAGYFWNSKSQAFGFVGGYGLFSMKNWVWEYQNTWSNTIQNNSNAGNTVPVKRCPNLMLGKPGENKVYFASGYGNASGNQHEQECKLGEPWANDVGTYCWLKDVWELDLNTNTFKNHLPVNHFSFTKEGAVAFDHEEMSFVKIGGFIPPAEYTPGNQWASTSEYSMEVSVFKMGTTDGFVPVATKGDAPPVVMMSELGHNAVFYDGKNDRILYIRSDGIWSLSKSVASQPEKVCNYTIKENDTTICKNQSVQLSVVKPSDSTCFSWDDNTINYFLDNSASPNPARYPKAADAGYIELGAFGQQQVFSVSMWVKVPDVQPNTFGVLLDCSHRGSSNWVVQTLNGGKLWAWNDLSFSLKPNTWQHVQFVYNQGSKKIYVDGEKVSENATPIQYSGTPTLTLGNWREGGRRFNGSIDEVYITLEEQVFPSADLPKRIEKPSYNAFGLWHFDEGKGTSTKNILNDNTTDLNNWTWNQYPNQQVVMNPLYEWSTGQKDPVITVTPNKTSTYYLTTVHGSKTYVDSITIHVSDSEVDIFGHTKIHERQVNHAYYTEYHDGSVYHWEVTGNAEIASSNGGSSILVNFKDPGFAYIKVTETNKNACVKDTMLTVKVYGLTDVAEGIMGNTSMMSVFPNPVATEDVITIKTIMSPGSNGILELLDVLGTQLTSITLHSMASYQEYTTQIPIGQYPNGMYMIRYNDGEKTFMEKLMIGR